MWLGHLSRGVLFRLGGSPPFSIWYSFLAIHPFREAAAAFVADAWTAAAAPEADAVKAAAARPGQLAPGVAQLSASSPLSSISYSLWAIHPLSLDAFELRREVDVPGTPPSLLLPSASLDRPVDSME